MNGGIEGEARDGKENDDEDADEEGTDAEEEEEGRRMTMTSRMRISKNDEHVLDWAGYALY